MAKRKVVVSKDGPYLVSGGVPLATEIVVSDREGMPLKWKKGRKIAVKGAYALCRCGHSAAKPFCDGAHVRTQFKGTETASRVNYDDRAGMIDGPGLVLTDVPELCAGAGFCHRAGGTWALTQHSGDAKSKKLAIKQACDCPSGRLIARDKKTRKPIEPKLGESISVTEDPGEGLSGPLWAKDGLEIESADGRKYEKRNRVTLCRCGYSSNKPFCDGTHKSAGFSDGDKPLKKK